MPDESPRLPGKDMTSPARPAKSPAAHDQPQSKAGNPISTALRVSKRRLFLAIVIAGLSDVICFYASPLPPVVWTLDLLTAILLFAVLGWQWFLLPGLVMEAIPGVGVIPVWLLVVGAIALWGTARPNLKRLRDSGDAPTEAPPPSK